MRIRNYRPEDLPTLVQIQQATLLVDGGDPTPAIEAWLRDAETDVRADAFVITDDDDELNTWGQAGTLDGIEGEIVGYTTVTLRQDPDAYHFLCRGAVHPQQRQRGAGRLLLVGALNRARSLGAEFEYEAEQAGVALYFEVLFPTRESTRSRLTEKCELQVVAGATHNGAQLYRREVW